MKKLFTLVVFAVVAAATFANGPVLIKSEWTYDGNTGKAKLELEFTAATSFPVDCRIIVQDEITEAMLDTVIGAAMNPTRIFFVDGLAPNSSLNAIYAFENGDGQTQYTQQFNTLVSGMATVESVLPTVTLANGTLNITADYPVGVQVFDVLGRMVAQHGFDTDIRIDMLAALHQSSCIIRITDRNNKVVLTSRQFLN